MAFDAKRGFRTSLTGTANDDNTGSAEFTEPWTVASTSPSNALLVKLFAPIPRKGNTHPDDSSLRVRTVAVTQVSPIYFEVEVTYFASSELGEDPLNEPAKISITTISSTEEIDEDINGDALQTVNGEPLVGATEVIPDLAITVQRNLPSFDPFSVYEYVNKVNSDSFLGFPPGTVKITDIRANNVITDDYDFWSASVTFQAREPIRTTAEKSWWKRLKHQGLKIKDSEGNIVTAIDDNQVEVTSPVSIKLDGTEETDKTKAHFKEFETVGKIAFAGLNLLA